MHVPSVTDQCKEHPVETTTRSVLLDSPPAITLAERCDSCGAQAFLRATMPSGTALLFCGHHGNAHRASLLVAGAALQDETDRLTIARESGFG
jgi:hypothetical protein